MLFLSLSDIDLAPLSVVNATGGELRVDLLPEIDLDKLKVLLLKAPFPFLLTLRSTSHGGKCSLPLEQRMQLIENLCKLSPAFIDLEYDLPLEFLLHIIESYPQISPILSYHNTDCTPTNIESIYSDMSKIPAFAYKIATMVDSTTQALELLLLSKKHPKLSVVPMGEKGSFARVISLTHKNKIGFASLCKEQATAPGQLSLEELTSIYRYPTLKEDVDLYGLIGEPVSHSIGHLYHNLTFKQKNRNALYVKMSVTPNELSIFFPLVKKLGFRGFSVTTPLKEKVLPFIDILDAEASSIQACNTLLLKSGKILGKNVDGMGALDALEKHLCVSGKKIVLLGAGGSCKAIAFEAKKRGAKVHISNRTLEKAKQVSLSLGTTFSSLEELPLSYDILINTTSHSMPIHEKQIVPNCVAMDITYTPKETLFLQKAKKQGCSIVYGEEMFRCQAEKQSALWNEEGGL